MPISRTRFYFHFKCCTFLNDLMSMTILAITMLLLTSTLAFWTRRLHVHNEPTARLHLLNDYPPPPTLPAYFELPVSSTRSLTPPTQRLPHNCYIFLCPIVQLLQGHFYDILYTLIFTISAIDIIVTHGVLVSLNFLQPIRVIYQLFSSTR